ncbi:phosphotransferase family protein [Haladaptatus sp. CMSO5]|uniref:phosphotransferase family protein n=1 Tax=Haladaptatus sp. CMSO5 TaxID=3120514 RepID=UPI002FCE1D37
MDAVRAIVAREFPDREVASVTPTTRGNQKETAVVRFTDGATVVVQHTDDSDALATESMLAQRVRAETSVPVPRQLAQGTLDARAYVVVEHADGADLHERFTGFAVARQQSLAAAFGRYLAEVHEVCSFDAFGDVVWDSETADFRVTGLDNWASWFRVYALAGVDTLPAAFDDFRERLRDVFVHAAIPESPASCLYPWDFRPGNALVQDGTVTALIDWGDPLAGAPGLSVAKAEHLVCGWYVESSEPLRVAFRRGYETVRPYPAVDAAYRLAAIVHSVVDSHGDVTRPGFPERTGVDAVSFHRARLAAVLSE